MNGVRHGEDPYAARATELDRGARGSFTLDLLDPARIDVGASRVAGEPRRAPAAIRVACRPPGPSAPRATLLLLHDAGAGGAGRWAWGAGLVDVAGCAGDRPPAAPPAPHRPLLAGTDRDLACLRSAVLDLHAVLATWPRSADERIVLKASGVAAAGALVVLGAGLAQDVGAEDALRHELLLDLREGDALQARVVDEVASRIAAAVLIDPAGAVGDWRDVALARIDTPVALIERGRALAARGLFDAMAGSDRLHAHLDSEAALADLLAGLATRPAGELFAEVAARPGAHGLGHARHARGVPPEACPTEFCRSDFARDLLRALWRVAVQSTLRPGWS